MRPSPDQALAAQLAAPDGGRLRALVLELWQRTRMDWGFVTDRLSVTFRKEKWLGAHERRFVGEVLYGLVRHLRRLRGHMRAMQQYVAPAYPHPVLYVKAGQRRAGVDPAAPESAWRARAARFSFAVVDGDHVSMHQTPHVTAVAAHIRDAFAALSRRAARIGSGEIRHV